MKWVIAVLVVAALAFGLWAVSGGSEDEAAAGGERGESDDEDGWGDLSDSDRGRRGSGGGGEWLAGPRDRAETSDERRARWRREWMRTVEIVPLGPAAPGFDAATIREALAPSRRDLGACVDRAGGFLALREEYRSAGYSRRRRGHVSFDIRADGTVDPSTIEFEPRLSRGFDACFRDMFGGMRIPSAGADGAHVVLPMMGGMFRRRRPRDGGV